LAKNTALLMERSGLQAAALFLFQLILAEGWIAVAVRPDPAAAGGAGPSEQRAATQPDPANGRGSPKTKKTSV